MSAHARRAALLSALAPGLVFLAWILGPPASARGLQAGGDKTVFAGALDSTGAPIAGLAKEDWGVREDGADRPLVDVKPATDPLGIVVLVDVTKGIESSVRDVRTSLVSFVHAVQAGNPSAVIGIMGVSGQSIMLADVGKSPADLDKAIQRLFPDSSQSTTFLEAIIESTKKLAKVPSPRHVIVALNLEGPPEASTVQPQIVANTVAASGASLWVVSYRNTTSNTATAQGGQLRDLIFNRLTTETGGIRLSISASSAIEGQLKRVSDMLLAQYAVTYKRPDGAAPKLLQMAVARPGAQMLVARTPPK
jgi:hypothetical protein